MGNGDGVQWGFSIQKEDSTLGSQLVVVPLCLTLSAAVGACLPPRMPLYQMRFLFHCNNSRNNGVHHIAFKPLATGFKRTL